MIEVVGKSKDGTWESRDGIRADEKGRATSCLHPRGFDTTFYIPLVHKRRIFGGLYHKSSRAYWRKPIFGWFSSEALYESHVIGRPENLNYCWTALQQGFS
jgi:hypothetical protein